MFRCAFLGCGGRARGHAQAYRHVKRGELVALCDMNESRLHPFGDEFGVAARYTDMSEMLDKEKPDLLHIVTPPTIRHSLMSLAAEHGVPAVIIEKPVALQGEDYLQLRELERTSATKFIVNTQLHFHPNNLMLKQDVREGRIGEVRFVDGSARSTIVDQGPHVLELVSSYLNWVAPTLVFGQVSGGQGIGGLQPSPAHATGTIAYESGVRAQVTFGVLAGPKSNDSESIYMHKRIAAYGTKGWTHWWMSGWERFTPDGGYESGSHSYGEQDVLGQAGLTEAVFDWLEDENKPHPTRLAHSLSDFSVVLALYTCGLTHGPVSLPFDPSENLLAKLKEALA